MLAAVIVGPTTKEALEQIRAVKADIYELRLDLFTTLDMQVLKTLKVPLILTFKEVDVRYVDAPGGNLHSYHNFEETYKIATMANSTLDTMRILLLQKKVGSSLCAIAMGKLGQPSRILGPIFGNPITYAGNMAPGQMTVEELKHYRVNTETAIYGLIGDVDRSISHITHNAQFRKFGLNAVYVKFQLGKAELPQFLEMAQELGIRGLSVTSPLKEAILPYIDHIDPEAAAIGAVNTLKFTDGKIYGYNTDAKGALEAIESYMSVAGKKIQIYGAGGAARALTYILAKNGAHLFIENRTKEKAKQLAEAFGCTAGLCPEPDLAINCTTEDCCSSAPIVLDIHVRKAFGQALFFRQALGQFKIWF